MALHDKSPIPPIVSLRRYGDIINLLPLLRFIHRKTNTRVKLIVHRTFANVIEGVSYVEPIIWDGDMDAPLAAAKAHGAVNAQVHGLGLKPDPTQNYAKRAWRLLGYEWSRHSELVFDRRDALREKKLVPESDLPIVLVKLHGFSSVFKESENLWALLRAEFDGLCQLVDLDKINADRIYDLLGLLDSAACLVTVDTVTLWLARGSKCPVVALVNDLPYLASPPVGNVLVRLPYRVAFKFWEKIASAIHSTLFDPYKHGMVHVFQDFQPPDENGKRRHKEAMATWHLLGARQLPFTGKRSSKSVGDNRGTPFIKDMVNAAISTGGENIIIISNNDVKIDPHLSAAILESCNQWGCYWAYRLDQPNGKTDHGGDLFAFTRKWWFMHQHLYPDMLLGYLWWDDLLVRMMRWSGCAEQARLYYHEPHPGVITRPRTKGSDHNEIQAHEWLKSNHELNRKP